MVVLVCPNCGASLTIESDRQFAFCQYCGTKIANMGHTVEVDRSTEIANLLIRAIEYESKSDYAKAKEYCDRVLDMDPSNETARLIEKRLLHKAPDYNIIIRYIGKRELKVKIDNNDWISIQPDKQIFSRMSVGLHRVLFSERKIYDKSIMVNESDRIMVITYIAGLHNTVTMSYC